MSSMISKDTFIILQSGTALTGALCRAGLKSRDIVGMRHVCCADLGAAAVAAGVRSLLDGLAAEGARPDEVRLCLSAENALFRDWDFPFSSPAKIRQALALLLESEFPFDPALLEHRVFFAGPAVASRKGRRAVSVSLRREETELWLDALAAAGVHPRLVTVAPFPLLRALPAKARGTALLLHVERDATVAALLEGGAVRRIRSFPEGWPEGAGEAALDDLARTLRRESELMQEGTRLEADGLLLYGEAFLNGGAGKRFAEAFGLPAATLGLDTPLAGHMARLGEDDPSRLLALCVAALPLPSPWRNVVSFHRPPPRALSGPASRRMAQVATALALAGAAFLCSVGAEGYASRQEALRHEAAGRDLFRKALPEVRGAFGPTQMESILKTRIAALRGSDAEEASFPSLRLLRAMHAAVPPALNVRIDRLSLDAQRCGLSGTASGYEAVNALRGALAGLPEVREAKILSAANRTGRADPGNPAGAVLFEIEMTLEGGRP